MKIMSVFGTRPEAIKMCPLLKEMQNYSNIESIICLTGQHREMLRQVMETFGIHENYNLNIMREKQSLFTISADILLGLEEILQKEQPDIVLVHGDTTTSFVAALSAFYQKIPVGHVEAGLRTYYKYSPFPEEINRNLTSKIADIHFAPTESNILNLKQENITKNVFLTGNTVIDAFKTTLKENYHFKSAELQNINLKEDKLILLTAHRRENWGEPLQNICNAVKRIAKDNQAVRIIFPVHLNPVVRDVVFNTLQGEERIHLIDPIDIEDMHNLMNYSYLILTDSGGIQEEAPACGVPVLVLRNETERPEAVLAGIVKVIGSNEKDIYYETRKLLAGGKEYERMKHAVNPYGDGHASERIIKQILKWFTEA